jgi:GT2 family glycosyltransferase
MTAPRISVCIANYNGMGLIDACIQSVRNQDISETIEIIVHDDASSDGSADHIRSYHSDVQLIESPHNVGFCVANNRMAAMARGDFLLLLNNDAELLPDGLQTLHIAAERTDQPAILTLPQFDHETGQLIDRGCLLDPFFNPVPNLDPRREDVAMVIGACLWLPRGLWMELGGFPEWFGSVAEDMYLCCRARLAGHPVRVSNQSGYRHRVGQSFGGGKVRGGALVTSMDRRALSERNKTYVMLLIYPPLPLAVLFPLHLLALQVEGLLLSLLKRRIGIYATIYGPVLPALWRERHRLLQARRDVRAIQKISFAAFQSTMQWSLRKAQMLLRHGLPEVRQTRG